jgi:hypothetical protein
LYVVEEAVVGFDQPSIRKSVIGNARLIQNSLDCAWSNHNIISGNVSGDWFFWRNVDQFFRKRHVEDAPEPPPTC